MDPSTTEINFIATWLGLPIWDTIEEGNLDVIGTIGQVAYRGALANGASESEAESARDNAEQEAQRDVWNQWYDGVRRAADQLLADHGLALVPRYTSPRRVGANDDRPYDLRIVARTTWRQAADQIRRTINGVGMFEFSSLQEFLRSGPYTARQAALSHLHWIKRAPDVYGGPSAQRLYEATR